MSSSSYITTSDLLSLSPSTTTTTTSSSHRCGSKAVAFCPSALLIDCPPEGEKDPVLVARNKACLSARPKLVARTYSVELNGASKAFSRAFKSVQGSLQPLLSPVSPQGSGVCSFSPSSAGSSKGIDLPSFSDSEDDSEPQSRSRTNRGRSSSEVGTTSTKGYTPYAWKAYDPAKDPGFTASPPTRLSIKLPSLARRRTPSRTRSGAEKDGGSVVVGSPPSSTGAGILKSPSLSGSLPLPSPHSALSTSPSSSSKPLSPAPTQSIPQSPPLPEAALHPLCSHRQVPLLKCCSDCAPACALGQQDNWEEKWSSGAKRKRRGDELAREGRETSGVWSARCGSGAGAAARAGGERWKKGEMWAPPGTKAEAAEDKEEEDGLAKTARENDVDGKAHARRRTKEEKEAIAAAATMSEEDVDKEEEAERRQTTQQQQEKGEATGLALIMEDECSDTEPESSGEDEDGGATTDATSPTSELYQDLGSIGPWVLGKGVAAPTVESRSCSPTGAGDGGRALRGTASSPATTASTINAPHPPTAIKEMPLSSPPPTSRDKEKGRESLKPKRRFTWSNLMDTTGALGGAAAGVRMGM